MADRKQERTLLRNFLAAGLGPESSEEDLRKAFLVTLFSVIGFCTLLGFGVLSVLTGRELYGALLCAISLLVLGNYFLLRTTRNLLLSSLVVLVSMMSMSFGLLLTGGVENTGYLWYYLVPLLAFFLLGARTGFWMIAGFFVVSAGWLILPDMPGLQAEYPASFKQRFFASFLAVCILSYIYEYSRSMTFANYERITRQLEITAHTDELTGLSNRREANIRLDREVNRARRRNESLSVVLADIDFFKTINDTHGHDAGDQVLIRVGQVLRDGLRDYDMAARWGGEEFLIILPGTSRAGAIAVANRLRQMVADTEVAFQKEHLQVTVSMGVESLEKNTSRDKLVTGADASLYQAKREGRNRVFPSADVILPMNASRSQHS